MRATEEVALRLTPSRLHRWALGTARAAFFCLVVGAALPAVAQEMIVSGSEIPFDRARLSGFVWRGEVNGTIDVPALQNIPGFRRGLDIREDLGVTDGKSGWLVGADVGVAPRHRFVVSFTGMSHNGFASLAISEEDTLLTSTDVSVRDASGAYEFLFSRRDWIRAGVLVGLGYFNNKLDVTVRETPEFGEENGPVVVTASEVFKSPYPLIGGSVLLNAEVVNIYVQVSGFPSITAGDQSGSLLNVDIDFIVYATPTIGIIAGYKRYSIALNDGEGVGIDLVWDGFVIGGQYIF